MSDKIDLLKYEDIQSSIILNSNGDVIAHDVDERYGQMLVDCFNAVKQRELKIQLTIETIKCFDKFIDSLRELMDSLININDQVLIEKINKLVKSIDDLDH